MFLVEVELVATEQLVYRVVSWRPQRESNPLEPALTEDEFQSLVSLFSLLIEVRDKQRQSYATLRSF